MDRFDCVWPRDDEIVVTTFEMRTAKIGCGQPELLHARAHGTVEDENSFFENVQVHEKTPLPLIVARGVGI